MSEFKPDYIVNVGPPLRAAWRGWEDTMRFVVNRNPDRRPMIHDSYSERGECNLQEIADEHRVETNDTRVIEMLIADSRGVLCDHCFGPHEV